MHRLVSVSFGSPALSVSFDSPALLFLCHLRRRVGQALPASPLYSGPGMPSSRRSRLWRRARRSGVVTRTRCWDHWSADISRGIMGRHALGRLPTGGWPRSRRARHGAGGRTRSSSEGTFPSSDFLAFSMQDFGAELQKCFNAMAGEWATVLKRQGAVQGVKGKMWINVCVRDV